MFIPLVLPQPFSLCEHTLLDSGRPVGILNPGVLLAQDGASSRVQVIGPRGGAWTEPEDPEGTLAALLATGSILLGTPDSISAVQKYLQDDRSSRTAAYLCSIVDTCQEVECFFHSLSRTSVAVIGCGGIGSLSALMLAGAGIKRLTLVDGDVVEASNFNRQFLWTRSDLGALKVDVLRTRIQERFPDVEIWTVATAVDASELPALVKPVAGVLFTADEPVGLVRDARRVSFEHGKIFVSGGYVLSEAVLSGSAVPRPIDTRTLVRVPHGIAPSFGPTNAEVAGACSTLLMLKLAGLIGDHPRDSIWRVHQWPWDS